MKAVVACTLSLKEFSLLFFVSRSVPGACSRFYRGKVKAVFVREVEAGKLEVQFLSLQARS